MTATNSQPARRERLMQIKEVIHITGLARSTIYARMDRDSFPRPVAVTPYCVRWRESDIDGWINSLPVVKGRDA